MAANEDRDALFGVIALELGFVTRDDITAARRARKAAPEESLGHALLGLNCLGGDEYALLDALVQKHLQRHGDDPRQSLAALRVSGMTECDPAAVAEETDDSVATDPGGRRKPRPRDNAPSTISVAPDAYATSVPESDGPAVPTPPPRFRILRHHASGGLGRVMVAFDEELNREVALKEIHARYAHIADSRSRFLLEAEVTGRLEHPGIVPVYGLGRYADGLPYYAMRFIQGESLKTAIQTFFDTRFADAGQRALALRHLLGVFVAVCQAVRYAHSRGIVHRDLKPENVMLGKFGETLVVDWGLAKSVPPMPAGLGPAAAAPDDKPAERSAEGPLHLEPDGAPLVTRAGTVLGTPGYMSPEQADGLLGEVGPASDVYSLGATLYTILTGKAPMTATDLAGALAGGGRGSFPPPRAVDRRVPRALEAVCLKAMALVPRERYPGARELAEDVERWLAYEPVTAYRESPPERLARWVRKHPARVAGLTAAALMGAAGLLAVVLVVGNSNRELADANRRESAARRQADAGFREAQAAVNEFFTEISDNKELLKKQPGTQALRRQLLAKARDYYEGFLRERGDDSTVRSEAAAAHYRLGEITNSLDPGSPKAVSQYERAAAILEPLLREGPRDPDAILLQAKLYIGMGTTLSRADRFDEGLASYEKSRSLLEDLTAERPGVADYAHQLARTFGGIAYIQGRAHRGQEAMAANARAATIGEGLVKEHPDVPEYAERLAMTYLNMGSDWKAAGDYKEAVRFASRSQAVAERLVAKYPGVAQYGQVLVYATNNLGHYQTALGQIEDALSTLTRGTESAERLVRENPGVPDYANIVGFMFFNRGSLQLQHGDAKAARASLSRAQEIIGRLTEEYPALHQYANTLSRILEDLGWADYALGKEEDAAAAFSRSLAIRERLVREDPKTIDPASDAARVLADCPVVRIRDLSRATALARQCLEREPNAPGHLLALGMARYRAGDAREAAEALEKAVQQFPEGDGARPVGELALVLARWQTGQRDAARDLFEKTTARLDKAGLKHPAYEALRAEAGALLKADAKPAPAKTGR
jgi:serine/threonine-protein kinase